MKDFMTQKTNTIMKIEPYLFFDGRCEEAIEFYKKTIGAEVTMLMRFKDNPDVANCPIPPGSENKIMHANLRVGDSQVMASDGECKGKAKFDGFALSLNAANPAEAERLFKTLGEGGQVVMPMAKTFFSPAFGMVQDRFGVTWMVIVPAPMPGK
jgi:PhnB protein